MLELVAFRSSVAIEFTADVAAPKNDVAFTPDALLVNVAFVLSPFSKK